MLNFQKFNFRTDASGQAYFEAENLSGVKYLQGRMMGLRNLDTELWNLKDLIATQEGFKTMTPRRLINQVKRYQVIVFIS